jgi:serine/threonine-protein kinase
MATTSDRIDQYVLDTELGSGAFGTVWRAHRIDDPNTPVALKLIEARGNIDQLMLEPALLSQLDHPCIVGIHDYFREGDRLGLVLEYVEGEDLKALLDRGETFTQDQVHAFLIQMAGALATAHERNIIHRDLKPSNILVVRDGARLRFVLTDFGIGQQQEGIQTRKHAGGTYLFMAPEQLRGRPTAQSDLWALGVVAYRMLTGQLPFAGPSLPELAHQILYDSPVPPTQLCREAVEPNLESVILKLLDKSLQERVASATELLRLLGHSGRPDTVLTGTSARSPRAKTIESLDKKLARQIRRRWVIIGVLAFMYLVPYGIVATTMLAGGLWLFIRSQLAMEWPRRKRAWAMVTALVLLGGFAASRYLPAYQLSTSTKEKDVQALGWGANLPGWLGPLARFGPEWAEVIMAVLVLLNLIIVFAPAIIASQLVALRRLRREKVLRDAALAGGTGSAEYLDSLRDAVNYRFTDVGFHQKYVEALVARGRYSDAAVEARLMLEQDPYHFNGNLLLASAYYQIGLYDDCAGVCRRYLDVSGYCFEFEELLDQCRRRAGK